VVATDRPARRARRIALAVLTALVALCAAELTCFVFFRLLGDRFAFANPELYTQPRERTAGFARGFDAELGWEPSFETPHGERRRERDYARPFLATFGDSHTFCDEVGDDETWQTYLARELEADVFNFGVSGYGPDQALLRYRRLAGEVPTPLVALGLGLENINRIVNRYRPFYFKDTGLPLPKPRFVLDGNRLRLLPNPVRRPEDLERLADPDFVAGIGEGDGWYERRDLPRRHFPYLALLFEPAIWRQAFGERQATGDDNPIPRANLWREPEARELYFAIMDAFATDAAAAGSRPLFVVQPGRALLDARRENRGIPGYNRVLRRCAERGYLCFDGVDALLPSAGETEIDALFERGGHASALGNRLMAGELSAFLRERGLVPEPGR
jgi:hypothetical protein